jgi:Leucine-rich repeat (LRR) protein
MSSEELRRICRENKLFLTPELNETLFCGLKGFKSISHLEPYKGLKALFLEGNALSDIGGIPNLPNLRCL